MSLPWFPFNIKDFLANTKRLNTEAKGAYLCLMLDYYEQEGPAPDDDDVLAAICELPPEAWKRHRKVIAPLFQIRDGHWHHDRIEHEIREGNAKLAMSTARAKAGAAAMHARKGHKPASSIPQAKPVATPTASSELKAQLEQSPLAAPLHKQESLSVSVMTGEKDNSGDNSPAAFPQNDGEFPQNSDDDTPTPISSDFWPCQNHIAVCNIDGADPDTIRREVETFIATHQERGTFSHDWDASWTVWWKRWRDHRDAQAAKVAKQTAPKPRVEVSTVIDWDAHMKRWQSGMGWPRGVGPDPSSLACRCPPEILAKYAKEKV